jgi:hypothetical protein
MMLAMGKYEPLREHLAAVAGDRVDLSFVDIERISCMTRPATISRGGRTRKSTGGTSSVEPGWTPASAWSRSTLSASA